MFGRTAAHVIANPKCMEMSAGISALQRSRRSPASEAIWSNQTNSYIFHRNSSNAFDLPLEFEEEPVEACNSVYFLLEFFHMYYIPAIILLGLVGNLLSCVVFLNTHLKMRSSSYYLAALATADFGFLVSLLLVWLNNNVGWMVFNKDGWCETLVYISAVCSSLSVWLIVAFTVERFIAVQYPLHRPHMCTIARAKAIVLILVILALASHSYAFVTAGVVESQDGDELCELKSEYLDTMKIISIIDSIASLIAPLILIIGMNTMIMRNLLRFSRRFKEAPSVSIKCPSREKSDINLNQIPSASSSNNGAPGDVNMGAIIAGRRAPSQQSFHSSKTNHSQNSRHQPTSIAAPPSTPRNACQPTEIATRCIHVRSSSRNLVSTRNQQSITKMLLLISTVFILLNLPSYVIRLCVFFFTLVKQDTPALLWCLQQFFMLLYYTNFSINFLLYAMCGITFRRCLEQLLRKILKSMTRYHCNPQRYI